MTSVGGEGEIENLGCRLGSRVGQPSQNFYIGLRSVNGGGLMVRSDRGNKERSS